MATTQNTFTGNGSNLGPFSFTFLWLDPADIKVSVNNVLQTAGTHYNLQSLNYSTKSGGQVLFTSGNAPANGATIRIYRDTDDASLSATFYPGSAIRSQDLNDNYAQILYKAQEVANYSVQDVGNVTLTANYTFSGTASGQTPTTSSHFATKGYVDGIAFAAGNLVVGDKGDITVNSASSWTINNGAVVTSKLGDSAVTTAKLNDSAVTTAKLNDSAVTTSKLATGAVVEGTVADGAITPIKLSQTYLTTSSASSTYLTQASAAATYATAASPTLTGAVYADGSYRANIVTVPALNIDCSAGNYFTKTINGNSTFTVSNVPASRAFAFTLELTHTSGTVTWFSGVQWPGGSAPSLTTGKVHLFTFVTDDGGTSWRGTSQVNYSS